MLLIILTITAAAIFAHKNINESFKGNLGFAIMCGILLMELQLLCPAQIMLRPSGYAISQHAIEEIVSDDNNYYVKWGGSVHTYGKDITDYRTGETATITIQEDNYSAPIWIDFILNPFAHCYDKTEVTKVTIENAASN